MQQLPEALTLNELVDSHPNPLIRAAAKALLDVIKDKTPVRTDPLRIKDSLAPH